MTTLEKGTTVIYVRIRQETFDKIKKDANEGYRTISQQARMILEKGD